MANVQSSGSYYVDSTGSLTTTKNIRVSQIIFTAAAGNDQMILRTDGVAGPLKIKVRAATANDTMTIPFNPPLIFPAGIYVDTITSGALATIITTGGEG